MNKKILVITPSFSGGSWIATEKIILNLKLKKKVTVVGLGKIYHRHNSFKYISLPYPKYENWGSIHSRSLVLSFLWALPLCLLSFLVGILFKPNLVIANGFSSGMLIAPFFKLTKSSVIVAYHGVVFGYLSPLQEKIGKLLTAFVDLVIVNSRGSADDIGILFPNDKIVLNEHYAEDIFFKKRNANKKKKNFVVTYVGSLNEEKLFHPLIKIAEKYSNKKPFQFNFAGIGTLQPNIERLSNNSSNIFYKGYLSNREDMKKLLDESDLLWSCADETYLAMPAVEALASGVPIVIPELPGMEQKKELNRRVSKELVPSSIGWLVNTDNQKSCEALIAGIQKKRIKELMRVKCREHALKKYSSKNLNRTLDRIYKIL